jgi:hypothetical protein
MMQQLLIIKSIGTCKYLLNATLMDLDMIHDPKADKQRHNTKIDSRCPIILMIPIDSR